MDARIIPLQGVNPQFDAVLRLLDIATNEAKQSWYKRHPGFYGPPGPEAVEKVLRHALELVRSAAQALNNALEG